MMSDRIRIPLCLSVLSGAAILFWAGCTSNPSPEKPLKSDPALEEARAAYEAGDFRAALVKLVDVGHSNPYAPGLAELRAEVMTALNDRRLAQQQIRREDSINRSMLDSGESSLVPDTYKLRRFLQGNDSSHIRPRARTSQLLDQKISLHFDEVSLTDILTYLGQEQQLNFVADPNLSTPPVTIHAEDIRIGDLFDYLSRNMDITFHMGDSVIWITAAEESRSTTPLYTRLYRIRHGMPTQYLTPDGLDEGSLVLLEALERFVTFPDGADLLFDPNTHILIVKNTEHNLHIVDQLVEALDVTPPQVLIEARFVSTNLSDLRELGIDWLLLSPVELATKAGDTSVQLNRGADITFGDSVNAGTGFTGTFTGILTDPQFRAVLHALETKSDARTLSAPKVIAVNNRPAFIRIGRDISYIADVDFERESFGTGENRDELLIRDPQVETLETGYQLEATVSVGANRRDISLRLRPEITELIRFRDVAQTVVNTNTNTVDDDGNVDNLPLLPNFGIEFPELARREIETEVLVQSGETVAMGGLMRQREQDEVRGIPLISSIPFFGKLFSRTTVTREQENLLVFVTATLISKRGEDLVPVRWDTPDEAETRGRFIENNADPDETISD